MKKAYIIPTAKMIVLAENEALLADSLRYGDDITGEEGPVRGDSKRRIIWDDEF